MKLRCGILTFHRALNYGAVLQSFALCRTLNMLGTDTKIVNYYSASLEETYKIYNFKKNNIAVGILKGLIKGPIINKKRKGFNNFINNNIALTKEKYKISELKAINDKFDFFITGSDQVWSPSCVGFDEAYFLTFADDKKKNSYAASIGCSIIPEDKRIEYKKRIENYNKISVRENNAIELLKSVGIEGRIQQNIDPTLLLSSDDYSKISKKPREKSYVLIFSVNMPVNLLEYAKNFAENRNLKLIYLNDKPICKIKGIDYKNGVSPEEFLGYIKNAEYVITNSFHGTVFSVIFHKNFFVEYNTQSGRNSRAEELLKKLGIEGREIISTNILKETSINWKHVDDVISQERINSVNYLKSIIGDYCE